MRLFAGTSGFSYAFWKGNFYPAKAKDKELLELYAQQLDVVEINNTFYRMPKAELMQGWAKRVPEGFLFVIKASQRITHKNKLEPKDDSVMYLWNTCQELGAHLGPVLFQLPPFLRKNHELLTQFLAGLPEGMRAVIEFRHRSWFDDETFAAMRERGAALCYSDTDPTSEDDPGLEQPFVSTADWGYVRLRRTSYDEAALKEWIARIREQPWKDVFVFFKHEPAAPALALELRRLWADDVGAP